MSRLSFQTVQHARTSPSCMRGRPTILLLKVVGAGGFAMKHPVQAGCRRASLVTASGFRHEPERASSDIADATSLFKVYLKPDADEQGFGAAVKAFVDAKDARVRIMEADMRTKDMELLVVTNKLKSAMAELLNLQGLLSMRGLMEYLQNNMIVTVGFHFGDYEAGVSWVKYVEMHPHLWACLEEKAGVDLQAVKIEFPKMYNELSKTPSEYQQGGHKLYIGPPLNQQQRMLMTCLCKHANVAYRHD